MGIKGILLFLVEAVMLVLLYSFLGFYPQRTSNITFSEPEEARNHIQDIYFGVKEIPDSIHVIIGTFLGNFERNYYGDKAPDKLDELWKFELGKGKSIVKTASYWRGAGWTGQPLLVEENGEKYIIQGAYDHHLRKIHARSGKEKWRYRFDDIIKGTGTIWVNEDAEEAEEKFVILQGSRVGNEVESSEDAAPSFRAVSYLSGNEQWRLNSRQTKSYSRDVDASALIYEDKAYIGLENGLFTILDPSCDNASIVDKMLQPYKYSEQLLYNDEDHKKHKGNLVTEASPCILGNRIYISSGSGHVFGYNLDKDTLDWEFYTGADMDGSPVVTSDSCLIFTIEKQYIKGRGGAMKVDPSLPPDQCVVWFFPTENKAYAEWKGGIIGSVAINDTYKSGQDNLAAFIGIDGFLYVVNHKRIAGKKTEGPDGVTLYPMPEIVYKTRVGPSIATPIIVANRIVAPSYAGISLFEYDENYKFQKIGYKKGVFESTPIADEGRIYIASRDGFLYCFGDSLARPAEPEVLLAQAENTEVIIPAVKPEPTEEKPVITPVVEKVISEKPVQKEEKVEAGERYHVIAGSFSVRKNADNYVKTLKKKGFEPEVFMAKMNYYYCSVYNSDTKEEAREKQKELQRQGYTDFWVLTKKD